MCIDEERHTDYYRLIDQEVAQSWQFAVPTYLAWPTLLQYKRPVSLEEKDSTQAFTT